MGRSGGHRTAGAVLVAGILAACLVQGAFSFHILDGFENTVWDLRARTLAAPVPTTGRIDVIVVDQKSLDWVSQNQGLDWPWPRELAALAVGYLGRAGTAATVFDVLFEQPSIFAGDDEIFARALKDHGRVVLAESVVGGPGAGTVLPPAGTLGGTAVLGHVRASPDPDGTNRRILPFLGLADGSRIPSLAVAAWSLGTGRPASEVADREAVLRYRGPQLTYQTWSAAQILQSEIQIRRGEPPAVDPAVFRGHYVFYGFSAPGLMDLRPSPLDPAYPGVYIHATHLDNLLAGDGIRTVPWYWPALGVLVWSLGTAWAVGRVRRAVYQFPVFLLALGLPVAAGWLAFLVGWWWPVVPPVLAAVGAGLAMLVFNYAVEGKQKRFIQNAFGQYLSPEVIRQLVADPGQLKLGGEKRCLSIFFSDVAGFTSIAERLDPVGLTSLLNEYLSEMTAIIYAHGGTIDKYEGDAIIAFWNAPLDLPDHALRAVRASLRCQARLAEIQPRLQTLSGGPVRARIGLNTGDVVIGNMGSNQRFNYTFLGDAGNLASRLEGINKLFGTPFLASEFTREKAGEAPDLVWREISRVRVVGKSRPVTVFEPLFRDRAEALGGLLPAFDRALRDYYAGDFRKALDGFEALADQDLPSQNYARRVRDLLDAPPPAWDGVWDAKEK